MKNIGNKLTYTSEQINNAILIFHPQFEWYNIKPQLEQIFEEWSNFEQLKNPIIDEFWNKYWDSEWYYMSQRTNNLETKKMISFLSSWYGLSRKSRKLYDLDMDKNNRIIYMRKAIQHKFNSNVELRQKLLDTWDKEIIEYTFWWDDFFGIDQNTLTWSNILWKLLMEYRDTII